MTRKSILEKEQNLLAHIAAAKNRLVQLQKKQKLEIGALACKHGLHTLDTSRLDIAFKHLAMELGLG